MWDVLNQPIVITIVASIVVLLLNRLYAKQPVWKKYEGTIIAAIKYAEKAIPDNTENKSVKRLDEALEYILKIHGQLPQKQIDEIAEGVQIVHASLEATGSVYPTEEVK